jgi:hypothetical protein
MPSHIFTRVGYWKESIGSNIASAKAAKESKKWDDVSTNAGLSTGAFAPPCILHRGRPRRQVGRAYSQYRQGGKSRL